MTNHHFISYPKVARDFAIKLGDALQAGPPSFPVWLDERNLRPGRDWDEQIADAIRTCDSLLFVMTKDSVEDHSVCKLEWTRALKYKRPVVPLLLERDADAPFRLANRQYIDFTVEFEQALSKLRNHLRWLFSPEGTLQGLKDRLIDAEREIRRAQDPAQQVRIRDEIELLKKEIADFREHESQPEKSRCNMSDNQYLKSQAKNAEDSPAPNLIKTMDSNIEKIRTSKNLKEIGELLKSMRKEDEEMAIQLLKETRDFLAEKIRNCVKIDEIRILLERARWIDKGTSKKLLKETWECYAEKMMARPDPWAMGRLLDIVGEIDEEIEKKLENQIKALPPAEIKMNPV